MTFRHPVILVLCLVLAGIPESVFAIDLLTEKDFRALRFEHKKMNSRLDQVINEKLKALQGSQESLLRQIEEIKNTLPEIQGSVEVNKSETVKSIGEVSQKLADIKTWLNDTLLNDVLMKEIRRQEEAGEKLRVSLTAQFGELKGKLAEDIEALSQNNERYLLDFSRDNNDRLVKMTEALDTQNKALTETQTFFQTFFKGELIPALEQQNEANRKALQAEMVRANTEQTKSLQASQKTVVGSLNQVVTSLTQMGGKNKSLVQILEKGIKANEETKLLAETLLANIVETNKNIDQNRKTMGVLQEILNQRLMSAAQEQASGEARVTRAVQKNTELINNNLKVADEKINRLAATLKTLEVQKIETDSALNTLLNTLKEDLGHVQASNQTADPKLNILIDASQQIAAQSSQIQLGLQESVKGVGASQAKVDLANQKLAKLIEILKTIAAEQEKAQQVLKGQGKVLNTQQAIKKALVDLKNKANVNISRNNAILKKIGK